MRTGTVDLGTYFGAFVKRYHEPVDVPASARNIIDLGANIGLVTLDLARLFPSARIIAVELDAANCRLLERNVAAISERVTLVRAAVWSHGDGVTYCLDQEDDAFSVGVEADQGHSAWAPSVTPGVLVSMLGGDRVDFVKMDIEGAEEELLLKSDVSWLESVEALAVEVHDAAWMESITLVLERLGFRVTKSARHWSALNATRG